MPFDQRASHVSESSQSVTSFLHVSEKICKERTTLYEGTGVFLLINVSLTAQGKIQ